MMLRPAIITFLIFMFLYSNKSLGQQTDSTKSVDDAAYLMGLSLDDLLKVKIVSASRKEESTFEAPTSSFVITSEEIKLMGATSIPDALKICPGLIVREVSNGTYDVSIRGGVDGFPVYNYSYTNTTILVMIDNRPVFSSLRGGTFWQNLPVGLSEIDRIEVVTGPSAPLYGPNAVAGAINIMTKRHDKMGHYAVGSLQSDLGNPIGSAQVAERFNDKWEFDFAINYENRTRSNTDFYNSDTETYEPLDSVLDNASVEERDARFGTPKKSLFKFSGGVSLRYTPKEDIEITATLNRNTSSALTPLTSGTQLANYTNTSQTAYLQGNIKNASFTAAHLKGTQGLTGNLNNNKYNYRNVDLYADYDFKLLNDKISIKPAVSYQAAEVDDREYTTQVNRNGTFDGYGKLTNVASSIKVDAKPIKNLRLILAGRNDRFNYPSDDYYSWQGIINYNIQNKHLFRFVSGSSYNGAFLVPILLNNTNPLNPALDLLILGNKNLKLLNNTSFELGYRTKVIDNTVIDVSGFTQRFSDFYYPILQTPSFNPLTGKTTLTYQTDNLDVEVEQKGITFSTQTNLLNSKLQLRPHITFQTTSIKNYSPYYNVKGAYDNPMTGYSSDDHIDSTYSFESNMTPSFWGGINIIYKPIDRLFIDISSYFYDNYTLHMGTEINLINGSIKDQAAANIKEKLRLNLNITYQVTESFSTSLNFRNITNQSAPEGFGTDRLAPMILGGVHINY